jgi:CRISPR-associated protein Cas5t
MEITRVHLRGWTASFRYPAFISGFQPSLPIPPLSTIYGLLSAAKGEIVTPRDAQVGFVFTSRCKAVDLETIYELSEPLQAKSNVYRREILFEPELYLYVSNSELAACFHKPYYPLLIGRSTELAMVDEVKEVSLESRVGVRLGCSLLPFPTEGVYGAIQALPTHFTDGIPRKAIGTRPFYLLDTFIQYDKRAVLYDAEKDWGVWMHQA